MLERVFIIAEAGVNHNGSMSLARKLIDVAVSAGCDAVKFQTFKTENVISKNARSTIAVRSTRTGIFFVTRLPLAFPGERFNSAIILKV